MRGNVENQFSGCFPLIAERGTLRDKFRFKSVGENDIVKLAVGNPVDIEVDAYWGKRFKGRVTEIASSAANVTETSSADQVTNFNVKIIILDESYRDLVKEKNLLHTPFKPGMTASVEIESDRKDSILVAPIRAVSTRQVKDSTDVAQIEEVIDRRG